MSDKIKKTSGSTPTSRVKKTQSISATDEASAVESIAQTKEAKKSTKIGSNEIAITKENKSRILKILEEEAKDILGNSKLSKSEVKSIERAIEMVIEGSQIEEEDN